MITLNLIPSQSYAKINDIIFPLFEDERLDLIDFTDTELLTLINEYFMTYISYFRKCHVLKKKFEVNLTHNYITMMNLKQCSDIILGLINKHNLGKIIFRRKLLIDKYDKNSDYPGLLAGELGIMVAIYLKVLIDRKTPILIPTYLKIENKNESENENGKKRKRSIENLS